MGGGVTSAFQQTLGPLPSACQCHGAQTVVQALRLLDMQGAHGRCPREDMKGRQAFPLDLCAAAGGVGKSTGRKVRGPLLLLLVAGGPSPGQLTGPEGQKVIQLASEGSGILLVPVPRQASLGWPFWVTSPRKPPCREPHWLAGVGKAVRADP